MNANFDVLGAIKAAEDFIFADAAEKGLNTSVGGEELREARAAVAELVEALKVSDAWIREARLQTGLQATNTLDRNRAALAKFGGAK